MSCTPLPKAAKPVWANQLTRLSCLLVYVKFQLVNLFDIIIMLKLCLCQIFDLKYNIEGIIHLTSVNVFLVREAPMQSSQRHNSLTIQKSIFQSHAICRNKNRNTAGKIRYRTIFICEIETVFVIIKLKEP